MKTSVIKNYLGYVEIRTKLASLLPFILALLYSWYGYHRIALLQTSVFFISMLAFDMSVTALNNYEDAKSDGSPLPFSKTASKRILLVLWLIAGLGGLTLVYFGGLVVLMCGGACFLVGILYSFGWAPISRIPLGEAFSGVCMGFFIPFLVVFINAPAQSFVWYEFRDPIFQLGLNSRNLLAIAVLTAPAILTIANIMLANNTCDVDSDVKVQRYTLPYYLGIKNAIRLFALLYIASYAAVAAMAVLRVLPPYVLVTLLGFPVVWRNIRKFKARQLKKETFSLSIANFLIIMAPLILITAAASVF